VDIRFFVAAAYGMFMNPVAALNPNMVSLLANGPQGRPKIARHFSAG
jgi:hypothetical protein